MWFWWIMQYSVINEPSKIRYTVSVCYLQAEDKPWRIILAWFLDFGEKFVVTILLLVLCFWMFFSTWENTAFLKPKLCWIVSPNISTSELSLFPSLLILLLSGFPLLAVVPTITSTSKHYGVGIRYSLVIMEWGYTIPWVVRGYNIP